LSGILCGRKKWEKSTKKSVKHIRIRLIGGCVKQRRATRKAEVPNGLAAEYNLNVAIKYNKQIRKENNTIRQCIQRSALFPGRAERDAGGAKRLSAERVGSGEIRESGEKFAKINFEIAYFLQFCKLKLFHLQCWQGY